MAEAIPPAPLLAGPYSKELQQPKAEAIPQAHRLLLAVLLPVLRRRVRAAPTTNSLERAAHAHRGGLVPASVRWK